MDEVVSAVRVAVSGLEGAATAAEAVDRGKAVQWAALADAGKRYEALRSAQTKLMLTGHADLWQSARAGKSNDRTASYAVLKDLDSLHPRFGYSDALPWPADTAEFLAWTARNGAVVWLPTTKDLSALVSERAAYFRDETEHYTYLDRSALVGAVNSGAVHPHVQLQLRERGRV
ncbi:hypothetical protein AB0H71_29995 [Nocardia sp. NPDC050697]|uniref:hypothetical protein n=1 Tax=Nocardia sp. NPDC050697 TaxID=3155158 RepID=UPI0033DCB015